MSNSSRETELKAPRKTIQFHKFPKLEPLKIAPKMQSEACIQIRQMPTPKHL